MTHDRRHSRSRPHKAYRYNVVEDAVSDYSRTGSIVSPEQVVPQYFPWGPPPYTQRKLRKYISAYGRVGIDPEPSESIVQPLKKTKSTAEIRLKSDVSTAESAFPQSFYDVSKPETSVRFFKRPMTGPPQLARPSSTKRGREPSVSRPTMYVSDFPKVSSISHRSTTWKPRSRRISHKRTVERIVTLIHGFNSRIASEASLSALYVGTGSEFWRSEDLPEKIWNPVSVLANAKLHTVFFSNLGEQTDVPHFLFPQSVEEVHFDSTISQSSFFKILRPADNLRALEIHISTLHYLTLEKQQFLHIHLSKLKTLEISSTACTIANTRKFDLERISRNAATLLSILYPRLTYLAVSIPYIASQERSLTKTLFNSALLHKRTLNVLSIEYPFGNEALENERIDIDPEIVGLNITGARNLKLSNFHLFSWNRFSSTDFWRRFLKTQDRLQYIQFWVEGFPCYRFPYDVVTAVHSHLQTLSMNLDIQSIQDKGNVTPIDFTVFANMPALHTLALKGNCGCCELPESKSRSNVSTLQSNKVVKPDIMNIQALPQRLKVLNIINLRLTSADVEFLAVTQRKLETLLLDSIGTEENLGVSLPALARFLENKHGALTAIELYNSINSLSIDKVWTQNRSLLSMYELKGYQLLSSQMKEKPRNPSLRAYKTQNNEFEIFLSDED